MSFEYKFVKIEMKTHLFRVKPKENYHEIIDKYSRDGWRLVQIFAPAVRGYGWVDSYELIFEREL